MIPAVSGFELPVLADFRQSSPHLRVFDVNFLYRFARPLAVDLLYKPIFVYLANGRLRLFCCTAGGEQCQGQHCGQ
jgi:hypothetical protein